MRSSGDTKFCPTNTSADGRGTGIGVPERSRTIEIVEFIDMKEVDPIYYDHPYYLVPSKGGEKAYRLLVEVMRRTNKAGLAKFVLAEREYLVAVTSRTER